MLPVQAVLVDTSRRTLRQMIGDAFSTARQRVGDAVSIVASEVGHFLIRRIWAFAAWPTRVAPSSPPRWSERSALCSAPDVVAPSAS